ncbi:MAG: gliding motility-associated C-terminal domain-containing protein [Flavobacteriales bacterium]
MKKLLLTLLVGLLCYTSYSQSCPTTSKNPWEWPSHRNWYFGNGNLINSSTDAVTTNTTQQSYEGVSAASDDQGNLLFYTNGRELWNAAGTLKSSALLEGNENGATKGSAAQGVITVRHPLNPNVYHIFTTDDALSGTIGLNYFTFDKNGNLLSGPTRLGSYRTTEGIAATTHSNGVDVWIAVQVSGSTNFNTYLLKCTGLVTTPVVSTGAVNVDGNRERGGMAFSWDGKHFAQGHSDYWPNSGGEITYHDFNNTTGVISNARDCSPEGSGENPYDIIFSPDNSKLYIGSTDGKLGMVDVSSGNSATMTASFQWIAGIGPGAHSSIELGADGTLYMSSSGSGLRRISGNLNSGTGLTSSASLGSSNLGLPTMYLPPQEEPDIQEVGPFCTTDAPVDLATKWLCSGLDAEDPSGTPASVYTATCGACINAGTGVFNPATAGVGNHRIIFTKCSVDDTIFIEVKTCAVTCLDTTLKNGGPICVGTTLDLTTMLTATSAPGTWTVQSAPAGANPATISGTTFSAANLNTIPGSYVLRHTLNPAPADASCPKYSERTVIVNALPTPTVADKEICAGDPAATFDAGSYTAYVWSANGTGTAQTTTGTTAGNYTVQVTDAKGCKASATGVLTVNALPKPTVANKTICAGDPAATFDAGSYTAYLWSANGTGTAQTTTGTTAGNYTVEVTDAKGCKASATGVLTVNALPTPTVANKEICAGDPAATFDAGSYASYVWSANGTGTAQTTSGTTAGNYTVQVTDAKGCKASATGVLTVNALPTPTLANKTICDGDPAATFDAGSYTAYLWSANGTGTAQTTSGTTAGNYTVLVTDAKGCKAAATGILTVNAKPTVNLGPDKTICPGGTTSIDAANAGATFAWTGPNNYTSSSNPITVSEGGTYNVTVTNGNGCKTSDAINVNVNANLTINLGNDIAICDGETATFTANYSGAGVTYAWTGPNGYTSATNPVTVSDAGSYHVHVADPMGCQGDDDVALTVNPLPTPTVADGEVCQGQNHSFSAGNYDAYAWTGPNNFISTANPISVGIAGTYNVSVEDANGCSASTSTTLTVNANPTVNLGADYSGCGGTSTTFDAGNTGATYLWSNAASSQTINVTTDGAYSVIVTDANKCKSYDTATASFIPVPTLEIGPDINLCEGESADITATVNPSSSVLSWTGNSSNSLTYTVSTGGMVYATANNGGICSAKDSLEVIVHAAPKITGMDDTTVCFISIRELTLDAGPTATQYNWSTGQTGQSIIVTKDGTYSVDLVSDYGCKSTDELTITEDCPSSIFTPTAFTPNNDGNNDVFYVQGENIYDFELFIFDRWGEVIFHSKNMTEGWNGKKYNDLRDAQVDVYVWKIKYKYWSDWKDGGKIRQEVGRVSLIR